MPIYIANSDMNKIIDIIQLTILYTLALCDLIFNILNYLIIYDYIIKIPRFVSFIFLNIIKNKIFNFWYKPQGIYFISIICIDLFIIKSFFNISNLVKYNLLLLFILLLIQSLFINYWELFFTQEISLNNTLKYFIKEDNFIGPKFLSILFLFNIFFIFSIIYIFFYINAIRNKYITFYIIDWLTYSIAFWLRIKI